MKKLLLAAASVAVLAVGTAALAASTGVKITSTGFNPANVTVQSGDSVNWTNADKVSHQVDVKGNSCKLSLEAGQSGACAFPKAGKFDYADPTAKGFAGTVTVAPNTRSVTLATSRSLNIFGDAVTLSGIVSSKVAGKQVTVVSSPAGRPATETTVTTTAGGNWSLQVQPGIKTTYQAKYDTASSSPVTVSIRPRITLQKIGPRQYLIVVLSANSMAGKRVNIARWSAGRWVTFQTATLQALARTPTTSDVYVKTSVRAGTKLRVFMPADQVGPNYLDGHSNYIVS